MRKPRILLVDDEPDLVWALQYSLLDDGYEVLTAGDGVEALVSARSHRPDLIILDLRMPRLSGWHVCHELRRDPSLGSVPIIMLTGSTQVEDRVKGLDSGADDYVTKPVDTQELKARVRALLRRSRMVAGSRPEVDAEHLIVAGEVTLDLHARRVHVGHRSAELTPKEFELLRFLMSHPDEAFTCSTLLEQVWRYEADPASHSLIRWHIRNLRAKIEPDPTQPGYLRTVRGHGYMLASHAARETSRKANERLLED